MSCHSRSFVIEFFRWCLDEHHECNWIETRLEGLRRLGVGFQDIRGGAIPSWPEYFVSQEEMRERETQTAMVGTVTKAAGFVLDIPASLTLIDDPVHGCGPLRSRLYGDSSGNVRLGIVTRRLPGPKDSYVLVNAIAYTRFNVHLAHPANGVAVYDLRRAPVVGEAIHHVPFARDVNGGPVPRADLPAYEDAEGWLDTHYPQWHDPAAYWSN